MTPVRSRLASLDVFRGLAVAAMIVVNNPGNWDAVYPPLVHAHWNGLTFADTVFPAFVFIVGVALPLSLARRTPASRPAGRTEVLWHIARRTTVLLVLGLLLNVMAAAPDLAHVRIPGVLQRIALAYAIAAPLVLVGGVGSWVLAIAVLLTVHTVLLLGIPYPVAAGTLTPAANLPGAIDAWLLGPAHLLTPTMDPEGLLGVLPTSATMLSGSLAGAWLRRAEGHERRVIGLIVGGVLALAAGWGSAQGLPVNKSLWTASFALLSAGGAALVFAACYAVIDQWAAGRWLAPLGWLGGNPLAIYFLSECTRHALDAGWVPHGQGRLGLKDAFYWRYLVPWLGHASPSLASLVFAMGFTLLWVAVAGMLYRRGVRIRI